MIAAAAGGELVPGRARVVMPGDRPGDVGAIERHADRVVGDRQRGRQARNGRRDDAVVDDGEARVVGRASLPRRPAVRIARRRPERRGAGVLFELRRQRGDQLGARVAKAPEHGPEAVGEREWRGAGVG